MHDFSISQTQNSIIFQVFCKNVRGIRNTQTKLFDYVDHNLRILKTTTKLLLSIIHAMLDIPDLWAEIT
jgi:hypothetical protein